ncbi:MAG: transposase [Deltaproteobacteria bacterium]|nr:MAG: transposase [Deltaproteobacteria bacterium]
MNRRNGHGSRKVEFLFPQKAIAMDMSSAHLKAIELYAPAGVKIIDDRYHLVANMNRVVDEVRRDEYRRKSGAEKAVMRGSLYLQSHHQR